MKLGSFVAAALLGLIALTHVLRLALQIPVSVNGFSIPIWVSIFGVGVPGLIALQLWRERGEPSSPDSITSKYASLSQDGKEELSAYLEYNKILRSWFVAFGVGGPALFIINADIGQKLAATGQLTLVSALFLVGAGSQVIGALINKTSNWYVYRGARDAAYQAKGRYIMCRWIVVQYWFDVVVDVLSVAAFGLATWRLLTVFGAG
jgi:hypothetical protein